jgi:predicted esterase YcpF (UPF0227 family)
MPVPSAESNATTHLLYLHGFRSSPRSFKAQRMAAWVAGHRPRVHWWCPQLPPSPAAALALLREGTAGWPAEHSAVVGSSLGGFYASVMAEATGWPAVVLNPAVDPARDLAEHIGEQTAWHDPAEHFHFAPAFVDELRAMHPPALTRLDRCAAIIATGDEVLDWREMSARYAGAHIRLVDGSDHALSDFDAHLPFVLDFLKLCD